jgi:hypothetical protein
LMGSLPGTQEPTRPLPPKGTLIAQAIKELAPGVGLSPRQEPF